MRISEAIQKWVINTLLSKEVIAGINRVPNRINEMGYDDWGMHPDSVKFALAFTKWLYDYYFRVEVYGAENIPAKRAILVANHGGQIPFDGMLLAMACGLTANPPRIVRGMVERWFPTIPFINIWFSRTGQVVGDPVNCRDLLLNEEAIMVFPEGIRGSGKPIWKRYQIQRVGTGFLRLALETDAPIVPAAIIGCEEIYPAIFHIEALSKFFEIPYFPITPFWPMTGLLGMLPLPMKVRIYFGKPLSFSGDYDAPESEVEGHVQEVVNTLQAMVNKGLEQRGAKYFR